MNPYLPCKQFINDDTETKDVNRFIERLAANNLRSGPLRTRTHTYERVREIEIGMDIE